MTRHARAFNVLAMVALCFGSAALASGERSRSASSKDDGGIAELHHCDVIVGDITGPSNYNTGTGPTGGYVRYALGSNACNIGSEPLDWYDFGTANPTWHPVIAQNIYRIKDGRLEQIGLSWLKHAQCALQQSLCAACTPFCGGCCDELGVGCSDPYSSSMNGDPTTIGPRSQTNPATGQILVWPYSHPISQSSTQNNNGQIHVRVEDINPALNPGAIYIGEAQYLSQDEATGASSHRHNNASYRRLNVSAGNGFPISFNGGTVRMQPAIQAWQTIDPTVKLTFVDVPDDGRMIVGCRVNDLGNGWWHYEYAVFNLNSDRAGRAFSVALSDCVQVQNVGFHDIDYHSGDGAVIGTNYEALDWGASRADGMMTWTTKTLAETPNANALRWGTMYNFRFDANKPPVNGASAITLFKTGAVGEVAAVTSVPDGGTPIACPGDVVENNVVDVDDLVAVILDWGDGHTSADCAPAPCGDGSVNVDDLVQVILSWGACDV